MKVLNRLEVPISSNSHCRFQEVLREALRYGVQGGGDVGAIPEDADSPLPDANESASEDAEPGASQESEEVFEQASEYVNSRGDEAGEGEEENTNKEDEKITTKSDEIESKKVKDTKEKVPRPRENARIRSLVEKTKAYEQRLAQFEEYTSRLSEQSAHAEKIYQAKLAKIERDHAVSAKELELVRAKASQTEEAGLSDIERFKRQVLREAEASVGKKWEQKLTDQDRRYNQLVRHLQKDKHERAVQTRVDAINQEADLHVMELLKGRSPEKIKALSPSTKTALLNYAAAHNINPREAAQELKQWAYNFVLSGMKTKGVIDAKKSEASKRIPAALPAGQRQAKGQPRVTAAQAKKRGFTSPLEAMINDNPPDWAQ